MSTIYSKTKIDEILEEIKEYKRFRKKITKEYETILRIRDVLMKHNYPNQLIYSKVLEILKDYNISPAKIVRVLDLYADPIKTENYYKCIREFYDLAL